MKPEEIQKLATCIQTMCGILDVGTDELIYVLLGEDFIDPLVAQTLLQPE